MTLENKKHGELAEFEAKAALKKYAHARDAVTHIQMGSFELLGEYPENWAKELKAEVAEILENEAIQEENEIRLSWFTAFEKYSEEVREISPLVNYGFSDQDLFTFCCYHKCDIFRKEIIDLLEDCNYHKYCRMLDAHEYDKFIETVMHEFSELREEKPIF